MVYVSGYFLDFFMLLLFVRFFKTLKIFYASRRYSKEKCTFIPTWNLILLSQKGFSHDHHPLQKCLSFRHHKIMSVPNVWLCRGWDIKEHGNEVTKMGRKCLLKNPVTLNNVWMADRPNLAHCLLLHITQAKNHFYRQAIIIDLMLRNTNFELQYLFPPNLFCWKTYITKSDHYYYYFINKYLWKMFFLVI